MFAHFQSKPCYTNERIVTFFGEIKPFITMNTVFTKVNIWLATHVILRTFVIWEEINGKLLTSVTLLWKIQTLEGRINNYLNPFSCYNARSDYVSDSLFCSKVFLEQKEMRKWRMRVRKERNQREKSMLSLQYHLFPETAIQSFLEFLNFKLAVH